MNNTQEFGGKDLETAIKNACAELNYSREELKYDVISSGASGIFGIVGRKDAKIRVSIPENKSQESDDSHGVQSIVDEAFGKETRTKNKSEASLAIEEIDDDEIDDEIETTQEHVEHIREIVDVTEESMELGIQALQKMADLITEDAKVTASVNRDRLTLRIEGGNAGILIGRKGQTLDAMQFLTDKMINRKSEARVRVKVDIEGYMETRKSNLKHLAFKMADKARKSGRPATINQMSAQDRRIVHLALKDDNRVRTQSMGDGYYRRLVIFPKRNNSAKGKKRFKQ